MIRFDLMEFYKHRFYKHMDLYFVLFLYYHYLQSVRAARIASITLLRASFGFICFRWSAADFPVQVADVGLNPTLFRVVLHFLIVFTEQLFAAVWAAGIYSNPINYCT